MSDYETAQTRRNIIVGIFVVVSMCALVWLIFKFGDLPVFVGQLRSFQVRVQFPTAPGVQRDTPVRFCGYEIGRVTDIKPPKVMKDLNTGHFYHQTLVILSIDNKYDDIPADVEAKLMTRGLGSSYIELKLKHFDVNEPTGPFLDKDSLLQGSTGMTSEFFPEESQKKLDELVDGLGTLIKNANDILGDPNNKENFKATLANLPEATKQATQALKELQQFSAAGTAALKNADKEFQKLSAAGTATLESVDTQVEKVVTAMVGTSEELSKTAAELRVLLEKINSGQGTLAKLVNDARLYEGLLEDAERLEILLKELKVFIDEVNEKGLRSKW